MKLQSLTHYGAMPFHYGGLDRGTFEQSGGGVRG